MNRSLFLAPIALFFFACAEGRSEPQTAAASSQSPRAASGVETKLRAALAGPARKDKEKARDAARHPYETLTFFGLRDDATVVELWPGGGYYTSILAPVLADRGTLVITHFDPAGDPKSEDTQEAKGILGRLSQSPDVFGRVARKQIAKEDFSLGPDASADFVLTFRNIHNWIDEGYADKVFAAAFRVLKHGGVLGVEEHRGNPGMTEAQMKDTGYVPEAYVVQLAEKAGFTVGGRAEINANPRDTKDHPKGVWALPPSFANKDVDRAKYEAIGESDRMALKLVKP